MDYLRQIDPSNPNPILVCLNQEEMLIGRHTVASLANFSRVSRYHACFTKENGSWYVKDLGSEYNLYVNFTKVDRSHLKLDLGDIIGFGTASASSDGGFVCVLKRQEENSLLHFQQTLAPCHVPEGSPLVVSSVIPQKYLTQHANPYRHEEVSNPILSRTGTGVFGFKRVKNEIPVDDFRLVPPLTPPKQSAIPVKRDIPSPCSTIAEDTSSDGYSSDSSLQIVYDANEVVKQPNHCQAAKNSCKREIKYESNSDCSTSTVPASPISLTKELAECDRPLLKIENVFHCDEFENDPAWTEYPSNLNQNVSCNAREGSLSSIGPFPECCVKLFRCDSRNFQWPPDVKQFNVSERLNEQIRYPGVLKEVDQGTVSSDDDNTTWSSMGFVEGGIIQKGAKRLCLSGNLKLKLKKNKIVSSESDETDDSMELTSSSQSLSEVMTESDFLGSGENLPPSTELENTSSGESCVIIPRKRTRSKKTHKRLEKAPNDDTDSSVSSHSEIRYPSASVIERIESGISAGKIREQDACGVAFSNSERKTAGRILLIEPQPIPHQCDKPRGRGKKCSISSSETIPVSSGAVSRTISSGAVSHSISSGAVSHSISSGAVSHTISSGADSGNDAGSRKICVEKSKKVGILKKSMTNLELLNQEKRTGNVPSKGGVLEKAASSKSQKKSKIPRRPLKFGSRMGFLTSMESDASKKTEPKSNNSQGLIKTSEPLHEPRISETPTLGIVTQTDSNRVERVKNTIPSKIPKGTSNKPSCEDDMLSVSNPSNSMKEIQPSRAKIPKNSNTVQEPSSKPFVRDNLTASSASSSALRNGDACHLGIVGNTLAVENIKQTSSKLSNGDNRLVSTMSTPGTSALQLKSSQGKVAKNSTPVENTKPASAKATNREIPPTAASVSTPKTYCSSSKVASRFEKLPPRSDSKRVAVVSPLKHPNVEKNCATSKLTPLTKLLIEKIVQWNPKWLQEQKTNDSPPPEVADGALRLPLSFKSFDNYVSFFHPVIVLDVWQSLFQKYFEMFLNKSCKSNSFHFRVIHSECKPKVGMAQVHCQALVHDSLSYRPVKGDIVLLNTRSAKPNMENCIFAYIYQHFIEDFKCNRRNVERWSPVVPHKRFSTSKLYKFSVYVKKGRIPIDKNYVNTGHGILNLKDKLMLVDALESFECSPLKDNIVQPTPDSFFVPYPESGKSGPEQIVDETGVAMGPKSLTKLFLLHGPPGTGKTDTVVQLLEALARNPLSKILVCAPCDSALDEIALRLMRRVNSRVKFVRMGTWPGIPMNLYTETLYRKTYDLVCRERRKLEKRIKAKEEAINDVLFSDGGTNYRNQVDKAALEALMAEYKSLQRPSSNGMRVPRKALERQVIDKSNVVLSTPGNVLPALRGVAFTCCIVDAATQCTELELLPCFMPSIKKLILLGDCGQLPPQVNSKLALVNGYGRSLFERFCLFFKDHSKPGPFLYLKHQYRMRPELNRFPSTYFYNEELVTARDTLLPSPLRPFILYDVMTDGQLCYNDQRPCEVIAYMCHVLLGMAPNLTIGVIANTSNEVLEYQRVLANLSSVEVNWLENFQGREKDIIIVPYYRYCGLSDKSWACGRKLNVTITRARQCLIVLGHASYLMHFKHWNDFIDDAKRSNNYVGVGFFRDIPHIFHTNIVANQAAF